MVHCDGLAMLLTDAEIHVFNPATGDVLKLPARSSQKNDDFVSPFQVASLGLDVSQTLTRSFAPSTAP
jgi:hypothetical protein